MICSTSKIGVKSNQDRCWSVNRDTYACLAICDGIGQFELSGVVAELLIEKIKMRNPVDFIDLDDILEECQKELIEKNLKGGTTLMTAWASNNGNPDDRVRICALGNGGIVRVRKTDLIKKRYHVFGDLFVPHITESGALFKHLSHDSGAVEMHYDQIELPLRSLKEDVLIFFTDGLFSLEHAVIAPSEEGDVWRYRGDLLFKLMDMIGEFIRESNGKTYSDQDTANGLSAHLDSFLKDHHEENAFDDDVAIGVFMFDG